MWHVKLCDHLLTCSIPERFRDEYCSHHKAIHKSPVYVIGIRRLKTEINKNRAVDVYFSTPTAVTCVGRNRCSYDHQTRHTKFNDESYKPIYFGLKRSKVKVTTSVSVFKQKAILPLLLRRPYVCYAGFSLL